MNQEPALELHISAAPTVEANNCVNGPDTRRNSGGSQKIKKKVATLLYNLLMLHFKSAFSCHFCFEMLG